MKNTKIRWASDTWNPMTGCSKITPGCDNCLDPTTPVLMADMTWRPIGSLAVGDLVAAFDDEPEPGTARKFRTAEVEATWRTRKDAYELVTADGHTAIASGDHRWFSGWGAPWRYTKRLRVGTRLKGVGIPNAPIITDDYMAGYIAGMTLGDGTHRPDAGRGMPQPYWRVALIDREPLDRLVAYLDWFGVATAIRPFDAGRGRKGHRPLECVEVRGLAGLDVIGRLLEHRPSDDFAAGWLAGMFDAEGSFDGRNVRISQMDRAVLHRAAKYGSQLGFTLTVEDTAPGRAGTVRLVGRLAEKVDLFTRVLPALWRKIEPVYGRRADFRTTTVESLTPVGMLDLVDITTSTGTFVAAGLGTHNCYAETIATKFRGSAFPNGFDPTFKPQKLGDPAKWREPRRIFVNSMSDVHHDAFTVDQIDAVYDAMADTDRHDYLILTKRPQRMWSYLCKPDVGWLARRGLDHLPEQIWVGTTIEDDPYVWRADYLRRIPALVRFLSCEPLIGPLPSLNLDGLGWVIAGGESGPGYRPMPHEWAADLRDRCAEAGVAYYFKQSAAPRTEMGKELDGRRHEEYPLEHPAGRTARTLGVWLDDPEPATLPLASA